MAVPCSSSSSVRFLQLELKKLQEEPVEGFRVRLVDDSNLFVWEVAIFGPPETLYEGGYYKVLICSSFLLLLFSAVLVCSYKQYAGALCIYIMRSFRCFRIQGTMVCARNLQLVISSGCNWCIGYFSV